MRYFLLIIGLIFIQLVTAQPTLPAIGEWREHLPYNGSIDLVSGNGIVYAATPYSLFSVDPRDKSVERYSRITGLNETGISAIAYDNAGEKLIIAYSNSNLDILYRNDIINIPDIKRDNIIGDKQIYEIYVLENEYFLSTGLGIIVIDAERYEVKDSWLIGSGGNQVRVNSFTSDQAYFYAATSEGLRRAPRQSTNLADYTNWELLSGINGLAAGNCQQVLRFNNEIIAVKDDSLFIQRPDRWDLYYEDSWSIRQANVSEDRLLLSQTKQNGEARVSLLQINGSVERVISQTPAISLPRKAILFQNDPWVADQFQSLSHFTGNTYESYRLNSPEAIASGEMIVSDGRFIATAGEVNSAWNYQYNGNGIYMLNEGNWNNINRYRYPELDTLLDFITVAVDRSDKSVWAGSYGGGLLHIRPDQSFEIIKQNILSPAIGDPLSYRVSGLAYDDLNQLWVSNYGAQQPLLVRKRDAAWIRFSLPFFLSENALTQIIIDDYDQKWIVAAKGGGLLCFHHGESIDQTGDDRWRRFLTGPGTGNLPDANVLCVAKDKSGFIWVGTGNGVGVIQCPQDIFSAQTCETVWPIVKQGNFAGYLFAGEEIRSIAIDAADRKWVATRNGVWLVSATGENIIYNFTEANSPLLSNDVKKITIDGKTGEVFFATSKGICSFRSTATDAWLENDKLLVFPNPVPPGFSGTIAIRGVVNNAIVKITEMNGRLVYQTRALGGQAVWNGKDYTGRSVSSGVYLVLVSDDGKKERKAGKIVFISK